MPVWSVGRTDLRSLQIMWFPHSWTSPFPKRRFPSKIWGVPASSAAGCQPLQLTKRGQTSPPVGVPEACARIDQRQPGEVGRGLLVSEEVKAFRRSAVARIGKKKGRRPRAREGQAWSCWTTPVLSPCLSAGTPMPRSMVSQTLQSGVSLGSTRWWPSFRFAAPPVRSVGQLSR